MPYEAAVPVHRRLLWPAVTDPERLFGALPNAVVEASGGQGAAGRLRLRLREQSVTFRGVARVTGSEPEQLRVVIEVEATFGRAGGAVEGTVELRLRPAGSGTKVVVDGQLTLSDGTAPFPADALDAALKRLVQRWFAALADSSPRKAAAAKTAVAENGGAPADPVAQKPTQETAASASEGLEAGAAAREEEPQKPKPRQAEGGGKRAKTLRAVAAAERAGLSVVRDVPIERAQGEDAGAGAGEGESAPPPAAAGSPAPETRLRPVKDPAQQEPAEPNPAEGQPTETAPPPLKRRSPGGELPPTVQLRLVPNTPEPGDPEAAEPASLKPAGEPRVEGAPEAAEPVAAKDDTSQPALPESAAAADSDDDDLWSRLRPGRRALKLPGALSPAAALGLLLAVSAAAFAILRRRRR